MNTSNYWYFKSALTPKFCDDVIEYGLSKSEEMAKTGNSNKKLSKEEIKDMKKIRNSNVVWLDEPWIYREIHPYIHEANKNSGWNFDWDFSENCQFTKYKLNQFYDWHCDSYSKPYSDSSKKNFYGKIRKLSVTCQLTDGSEYEGGELEFDFRDYDPSKRDESKHLIKAKDSFLIFP